MKIKTMLLAALFACGLAACDHARAADLLLPYPKVEPVLYNTGPYIFGGAGVNYNNDGITGYTNPPANTVGGTADLGTGYDFRGGFGWTFDNWGWLRPRAELEAWYLHNDLNTVQVFNAAGPVGTPVDVNGDFSAYGAFANVLLDLKTGMAVTPFIGGGVGFYNASLNASAPAPVGTFMNDSDTGFAWNLTAGAAYEISRNTTFELAYRFVRLQDANFAGNAPGGLPAVGQDIDSHQVNAGFRIKL